MTKTYRYDAFGVEYTPDANDTNYFRYCGQYFDTESGTYYLRARYYDLALGRFTQQDSWSNSNVGDPLSLNLYSYCKCNPIIYIDLTGCWPTWRQVFAAVAIVAITAVTVAAVVAPAGVAGAAVGMAAGMYLGASASTVAAITTVATVGAYGVAAGVAACGLSDAGESLTGTNVIRDYALKGNQKAYDVLEIGLDVASQIIVGTAIDSGLMNSDNSNDGDDKVLCPSDASKKIVNADRTGTASVKSDPAHRAASYLSEEQLAAGKTFNLKGNDGVQRTLLQTPGGFNGKSDIYEYILEPDGTVSHQRFIENGVITGKPNQVVRPNGDTR